MCWMATRNIPLPVEKGYSLTCRLYQLKSTASSGRCSKGPLYPRGAFNPLRYEAIDSGTRAPQEAAGKNMLVMMERSRAAISVVRCLHIWIQFAACP